MSLTSRKAAGRICLAVLGGMTQEDAPPGAVLPTKEQAQLYVEVQSERMKAAQAKRDRKAQRNLRGKP